MYNYNRLFYFMYNYDRLFFTLDSLALPTYALKTRFDLRVMVSEIKRAKWSQKGQTWKIITFFYIKSNLYAFLC